MLLGSLTVGLKAINILQPPLTPYNGFSVKGILERLKEMRLPQLCKTNYQSYCIGVFCEGVQGPLNAKTEELVRKFQGLEFTD